MDFQNFSTNDAVCIIVLSLFAVRIIVLKMNAFNVIVFWSYRFYPIQNKNILLDICYRFDKSDFVKILRPKSNFKFLVDFLVDFLKKNVNESF